MADMPPLIVPSHPSTERGSWVYWSPREERTIREAMQEYARTYADACVREALERAAKACDDMNLVCCGQFVTGAEYMGAQEEICCGKPEFSDATPAACAAAIRAMIGEL